MIAVVLAALAVAQPVPPGEWLLITVQRVIAPDQLAGQCFIQARVDAVVRGTTFKGGDPVAISLPCRAAAAGLSDDDGDGPRTIQTLRSQKQALVRLDTGGRVLDNGYYGLGPVTQGDGELS